MNKSLSKIFLKFFAEAIVISLVTFALSIVGNAVSSVGIPLFPNLKEEKELKKLFMEVDPENLFKILDENAILIDSRSKKLFAKSHIPSAINIPYKEVDKYYDTTLAFLPKETLLIVYCNSEDCSVSLHFSKKLKQWDFENIRILKGGFAEWTKREYKVEQGE